ncbi:MAG: glycosyltransferase family 4 protein [Bacteroidetes bacterium]|nr:glycosyltransferase family 4 protein [Bacteroidota bacterium]
MNLLILTFEFAPQPGGIATYSYQIAKHLHELGNTVTVLGNTNYLPQQGIEEFDNRQTFRILRFERKRGKISKVIHRMWKSLYLIRRERFDIILVTYSHAGIIAFLAKKLWKIPFVMVGHGTTELYYNSFFLRALVTKLFNLSDLILSNSNYTTKIMREKGIRDSLISTTFLGADEEIFKPDPVLRREVRDKLGMGENPLLVSVGSLRKRKGHQVVIKAIGKLISDFPNLKYYLIGWGEDEAYFKNLILDLSLVDNVVLFGHADWQTLQEFYNASDLVLLNSVSDGAGAQEGFGIVLVEAALTGKAVIGTLGSGIEDAVQDRRTGILIPGNDVEATAGAIRTLLEKPEIRNAYGKEGRQRALEHFTWRKIAEKTHLLLEKILDENPAQ